MGPPVQCFVLPVTVQAGSLDVRSTQPAIDYGTLGNSG
jgi:hypothetical protein